MVKPLAWMNGYVHLLALYLIKLRTSIGSFLAMVPIIIMAGVITTVISAVTTITITATTHETS